MSTTHLTFVAILVFILAPIQSGFAQTTFTNSTAIPIADGTENGDSGIGNPYPSAINVTGMTGTVTDLNVRINAFSHAYPYDLALMLVAPNGNFMVVQSDVGGFSPVSNITYTLDDQATSGIQPGGPLLAGTYKPSSDQDDELFPLLGNNPPPADCQPELECPQAQTAGSATLNGIFGGASPNGQWKLYAIDCCVFDVGTINGGWSLIITVAATTPRKSPFDFDGDGKTDIGIFRPAPAEWWLNRSSNFSVYAAQFGATTDTITPADFTGDGKTDIAFFRPSTGQWFVLRSEDSSFYAFPFGANGDIPIPADFDGDGKADAAVFRPTAATWYIQKSSGGVTIQPFGANGDAPVVADYDGDGKADIGIFRTNGANKEWWILRSSNGTVLAAPFGAPGDKAVPGDYTGDGKADFAFFRSGQWFVLRSEDSSYYAFPFGAGTDLPAPGDYDGDGKFDAGVFRPTEANWYVLRSTSGVLIQNFGANGDRPVPNAYVR